MKALEILCCKLQSVLLLWLPYHTKLNRGIIGQDSMTGIRPDQPFGKQLNSLIPPDAHKIPDCKWQSHPTALTVGLQQASWDVKLKPAAVDSAGTPSYDTHMAFWDESWLGDMMTGGWTEQ